MITMTEPRASASTCRNTPLIFIWLLEATNEKKIQTFVEIDPVLNGGLV